MNVLKFPLTTIRRIIADLRVQLVLLLSIGLLFVLLALTRAGVVAIPNELMLGCILSVTNAFLGHSFLEKAFRFNSNMFLIVSLAGMALRFFMMLVSIALILLLTPVNVGLFILTFMVSYSVFMFIEVFRINRMVDAFRPVRVQAH